MATRSTGWKILVAVDGSVPARRAVDAAARIPWPAGSRFRVVTVVQGGGAMPETATALRAQARRNAAVARAHLHRARWAATAAVLSGSPAPAILDAARGWRADLIVLGSRGLGAFRGALLGSVSGAVARAAASSVLVVKRPVRLPLRAVMAVDGSRHARVAARHLARLGGRGRAVTAVRVIEPPRVASLGLLPAGVGGALRAELARMADELRRGAQRDVRAFAAMFRRAGWAAAGAVRSGDPVQELLAAAAAARARLVCVGPRGVTGIERLLLGSVAERLLVRPEVSLFIGR